MCSKRNRKWQFKISQKIEASTEDHYYKFRLIWIHSSFGSAVDISPDGNFVVIGAPTVRNLKN